MLQVQMAESVTENPFADAAGADDWELVGQMASWKDTFDGLKPIDGKLSGGQAKAFLMASGLPGKQLHTIWELSDIDSDGSLDFEEFVLTMHLIEQAKAGNELPKSLRPTLVHPSKRHLIIGTPLHRAQQN